MSAISEDVYAAMTGGEDVWDETEPGGRREGPFPEPGETQHLLLGFVSEVGEFRYGSGGVLPGFNVQARFQRILEDGLGNEWGGRIAYFPSNMDKVIKSLPERSGRGNQSGLKAELGRMMGGITKVLGDEKPESRPIGINEINEAIAGGQKIGVIVNTEHRPDTKPGSKRVFCREYINDVFTLPEDVASDG